MTEKPKSLLEAGPANALSEGAARFEKLIESVKAQHAAPVDAPPAAAVPNPLLPTSPGEAWSRNFQSQSIAPGATSFALSDLAPVPRAMIVPPITAADIVPSRSAEFAQKPAIAPMAQQIGRLVEPRRRSWLSRMFGRADR
jgi:hypothetical protein